MRFYTLNPFDEIDRLERQINQVFNEFTGDNNTRNWAVAIELEETSDALEVRALLPGIQRDDLDIEVSRESVSIAGEYHKPEAAEGDRRFYSEFPTGKFRRTLTLPLPVANNEATADYRDGILTLTLPKAPEALHRVVKVNLLGDNEPKQLEADAQNS